MMMLQLTDTCWVNPDAVIAVEHAYSMAVDEMTNVHLDTGTTLTIPGVSVGVVIARLETFSRQQQADFVQTLQGDVRPLR